MRRSPSKRRPGIHVFDTEARTLDEALDIIESSQRTAKGIETRRQNAKPESIRQQASRALLHTRIKLGQIRVGRSGSSDPHPFRDLTPEVQITRMKELYDNGRGPWGFGPVAYRRLARMFDLPIEQVSVALGGSTDWIEDYLKRTEKAKTLRRKRDEKKKIVRPSSHDLVRLDSAGFWNSANGSSPQWLDKYRTVKGETMTGKNTTRLGPEDLYTLYGLFDRYLERLPPDPDGRKRCQYKEGKDDQALADLVGGICTKGHVENHRRQLFGFLLAKRRPEAFSRDEARAMVDWLAGSVHQIAKHLNLTLPPEPGVMGEEE